MALLQRITHPFAALLPDLNNVPQQRQAVGAVVASLVVHLLLLLFFVAIAGFIPDMRVDFAKPKAELQPLEMVVELPESETAPAELLSAEELKARAERPVIDSTGLAKSGEKPKDAVFESDQNMKAASEKPATGTAPLPSQDGLNLPFANFKDQDVVLGSTKMPPAAALPPPEPPAQPKATPAEPVTTPEPAAPPMAKATPPPVPEVLKPNDGQIAVAEKMVEGTKDPVTEVKPNFRESKPVPQTHADRTEMAKLVTPPPRAMHEPGFQEEQIKTRVEGGISNRGAASVDAIKTPLGVYMKQVKAAIGSRWFYYMKKHPDRFATGSVTIHYAITREGKIRDVRVTMNSSNASFGLMCEQCMHEAEITPPPEEAQPAMRDGKLEDSFTFNYVPIQ